MNNFSSTKQGVPSSFSQSDAPCVHTNKRHCNTGIVRAMAAEFLDVGAPVVIIGGLAYRAGSVLASKAQEEVEAPHKTLRCCDEV